MAKKDQLDYGEFSLDSDLDWDFDDSPKLQKLKKSKKPIDHFGDGVIDAVRSKFTDPYHIRDMVKKSLPHGLGRAWDEIEKVSDDLGKLYDDATKELRPHIGSLVRKIDAIVPDSATRAKNLSRYLKERFDQTKVDNRYSVSQEDTVNEGVERMLESLEASRQREVHTDQIARARDFVKDKIDDKRFQESHKALRTIANQGIAATEYLKTFDTAYKRKSLELQYRSYAAQSQALNAFVKYAERADKFQQALLHNTSLPEYAKTSNAQRFKERGKNKIMDTLHSSMFGKTSRIGLAGQRLKNRAVEKISSIKDVISMITDSLDAAVESHEMEKEFAEMSGKKASGWKTGGTFIGGVGAEFLSDYISDTLKSIIERNKTASKIAARAGRYAANPGAIIEKVKKSNRYKNFGNEGGISGGIKQAMEGVFSLLSGEGINTKLSDTGIGGQDEDQAVTIRRKTRAVTDVIPGYLARILREVTAIRTGDDKTPLLVFDSQSGKFKTESKMSSDLLSSLKKHASEAKTGTKTYAEEFNSLRDTFVGKDAKASKHDEDINKFLAGISRSSSDFDFTAESLRNTKEFKELSPSAQEAIGDILSKRFDSNDEKTEVRRASLAYKAASTREAIGNLKPAIETAMAEGHTELLEKAGVISRNSDGEWVVDEKRYFKFFDDTVSSDEDVKTNIRPFSGIRATADKALGAFKNTDLFNWDYKAGADFNAGPGINNRQGFVGPMAQDVRRNFGEDAAPGGRSLNLTNLNGYTMAAVKGLQDKVDQMGSGKGLRYLAEISDGIKELVRRSVNAVTPSATIGRETIYAGADTPRVQSRNTNLLEKSKNLINEGVRRSSGRQSSLGSPNVGSRIKTSLDKIPSIGENLKSGIDALIPQSVTSGVQNAQNTILKATRIGDETPQKETISKTQRNPLADGEISKLIKRGEEGESRTNELTAISSKLLNGVNSSIAKALSVFKNTNFFDKDYREGTGSEVAPSEISAKSLPQVTPRKLEEETTTRGDGLNSISSNEQISPMNGDSRDKIGQRNDGGSLRYLEEISLGIRELVNKGRDKLSPIAAEGRDAAQSTTDALLAQIRDINLTDKSKDVIGEIVRRSKSRKSLLNSPIVGSRIKASLDKMRSIGESLKSGIDSLISPPASSGTQKAQQTIIQSMGRGDGQGGILGSLKDLFSSGKKTLKDFGNSKTGKRLTAGASRLFGRGGRLGVIGRLGGLAKNSRLGKAYSRDFSRLGEMGKSALTGVSGLLGSLLSLGDSNKSKLPEESGTNTYSAADHSKNLADKIGNQADSYANVRGAAFGDRDGDGQRDGGASDRMREAQAARMANEERKKASVEASQKGALAKAQRISPADDAINKMIKIATAGLSSIAGMAGSLLGGAMDIFGGGGRRGKKGILRKGLGAAGRLGTRLAGLGGRALLGLGGYAAKGLPGGIAAAGSLAGKLAGGALSVGSKIGSGLLTAGSLLGRGISGVAGGLSGIGNAIKGAASLVPGSAKVARVALGATRVAQVVGLMSGGAGGMVSSVLGILGAGINAPVAIGAAAVAGVGYGGFKLYKYLTKNNIDEWQRIRILQYGLDGTDATKSFNSKVLALESYMLDGKLAFSSGVPSINPRAVNAEEIAKLFDISDEDTELAEKFSSWYSKRFQPVFLHHVATLYRVDNKASLDKLDSLDAAKKLEYLSGAEIDGIWSETTSPFKGLDVLSDNPKPSRDVISAMIQTQGKKLQEDAKNKIKTGDNKPKGENAANANKVIESAIKPAPKEDVTTVIEPESKPVNASGVNFTSISQTSKLAKMRNASAVISAGVSSEEGAEPKSAGPQTVQTTASNGTTALKTAMGNLSDGSNGMQFIKLGKDANIDNLNPALRKNLLGMAQEYGEATGKPIVINEGWRSFDRQAQLFKKYGPGRAARPGSSLHEYGLALDINTPIMGELESLGLLRKYGFTRPIRGETWHTEPAGIQQAIQRAKTDSAFATAAVEASLGRGGGGLGSKPNSSKGGRDPALAKRLYESGTGEMIDLTKKASSQSDGGGNSTKLSPPQINGLPQRTPEEMAKASGPGFASQGIGQGVQSSGGFSAEASLGDGTGKYDKIKADIAKYSAEAGADPNEMMMMAAMESSLQGSASAGTSSAKGLMQFVGDTWKEQVGKHGAKYNIDPNDIKNDRSQTILAAKYLDSYRGKLQKAAGGRKLEFVDKYMGHMFGPGGGAAMLQADQNASALSVIKPLIPKAGKSNREVFYDGTRERTVGEVRKLLSDRINTKAKAFGIQLNSSQGQAQMESTISQEATPSVVKAKTSSPPKGIDLATQLPMINPNAGAPQSVNPRPKALSGYDLPGVTSPMMFTYGMSNPQQPVRISSPMHDTAPSAAQVQYNRATSITDDLMTRMVASSDTATKHLESINDTLASRMVPLLEKIADNTGNLGTLGTDSASNKMQGTATSSKSRDSYAKDVQIKRADKSSFDNRRSLTV